MLKEGATTLWERWELLTKAAMNSHNHVMFGSVDGWFYDTLGGIYPDEPGFRHFKVSPYLPQTLDHVSVIQRTISGLVECKWKKNAREVSLEVTVPANTSATISIPKNGLQNLNFFEGEKLIHFGPQRVGLDLPLGIRQVNDVGDYFECEVGSGKYSFRLYPT